MNELSCDFPGRAMLAWFVRVVFAAGILISMRAAGPGPSAGAVDVGAYRIVLRVDQTRGDDIKGDGSVAKPLASIPRVAYVPRSASDGQAAAG